MNVGSDEYRKTLKRWSELMLLLRDRMLTDEERAELIEVARALAIAEEAHYEQLMGDKP